MPNVASFKKAEISNPWESARLGGRSIFRGSVLIYDLDQFCNCLCSRKWSKRKANESGSYLLTMKKLRREPDKKKGKSERVRKSEKGLRADTRTETTRKVAAEAGERKKTNSA
ncbi:hypothetical protein Y032_0334g2830 [Ancylostoma ceylanicum]|uniref:Uncharacterized protein n=1 Tax=Ancylostoma ceylanicum TaxID=53326 RepID=A0A016RYX2_9BILA|nr:hypothetical protein Y032_0334g2830 [Ancylostoma ceylanicum]